MIAISAKYDGSNYKIVFPCSYRDLYLKMDEMGIPDDKKAESKLFIDDIEYEELKGLKHQYLYPEQLEHLAQRLSNFKAVEKAKFDAVVKLAEMKDIKDMINLTYNMHRYTLIQDIRDMKQVGWVHSLTRNITQSPDELAEIDYAKVGEELFSKQSGQVTKYGLIFSNADLPYTEVYDGFNLPPFNYYGRSMTVEIEHNGRKNYVYLPDNEFAIESAVRRTGADHESECKIKCISIGIRDSTMKEIVNEVIMNEGATGANKVIDAIDSLHGCPEVEEVSAIVRYADTVESDNIVKLVNNMDAFKFIPEAISYEEVTNYLIDDAEEYHISAELREFLLDEEFAKDLMDKNNGKFIDEGVVMMEPGFSLAAILDRSEDQGMTMGGM